MLRFAFVLMLSSALANAGPVAKLECDLSEVDAKHGSRETARALAERARRLAGDETVLSKLLLGDPRFAEAAEAYRVAIARLAAGNQAERDLGLLYKQNDLVEGWLDQRQKDYMRLLHGSVIPSPEQIRDFNAAVADIESLSKEKSRLEKLIQRKISPEEQLAQQDQNQAETLLLNELADDAQKALINVINQRAKKVGSLGPRVAVVQPGEAALDACTRAVDGWSLCGKLDLKPGSTPIFALKSKNDTILLGSQFDAAVVEKWIQDSCPNPTQ